MANNDAAGSHLVENTMLREIGSSNPPLISPTTSSAVSCALVVPSTFDTTTPATPPSAFMPLRLATGPNEANHISVRETEGHSKLRNNIFEGLEPYLQEKIEQLIPPEGVETAGQQLSPMKRWLSEGDEACIVEMLYCEGRAEELRHAEVNKTDHAFSHVTWEKSAVRNAPQSNSEDEAQHHVDTNSNHSIEDEFEVIEASSFGTIDVAITDEEEVSSWISAFN